MGEIGAKPLDRQELASALPVGRFDRVEVVQETGSTNEDLLERGSRGEEAGLVLVAEEQTAGRGRLGRSWISPRGKSLLFSVLLRMGGNEGDLPILSLAAGVAAASAISAEVALDVDLKWPNDLVFGGRKFGGILSESAIDERGRRFEVVGIGINVSWSEEDFPDEIAKTATSLAIESDSTVSRSDLFLTILAHLDRHLADFERSPSLVVDEYRARCTTMEKRVEVATPGGEVTDGYAVGIDDHGRLLIEVDGEEVVAVDSGYVTVIGKS